MERETVYIKGKYQRSIYQNDKGYYIGLFKVNDTNSEVLAEYIGRTITFTGYFHELNDIDTYLFYGKRVDHEKYGEQFQVNSYERVKPEEKDSMIEFLTSGLFKGIGEKKAEKIVDVLGKDTLKIILEEPSNLILIPTITKKDADILHEKLKEYEASYEDIMFLTDLGFSSRDAIDIYNCYKKKTRQIVEEDIYELINATKNLTFKKIDTIALKNNLPKDADERIRASILYIIEELSNTYGHSYYYYEEIASYLKRVLSCPITEEKYESALDKLEKDVKIIHKEDRYYQKDMYEAETSIVKRVRILKNEKNERMEKEAEKTLKTIEEMEEHFNIQYNECQKEAIKESYLKNFLIITGGPGTGKTTILKGIVELFREMNKIPYDKLEEKVALLAPTGRAAKRMSEATSYPASTIHRFLKWSKETDRFQINEYNKSKVELVILDESSMIDTYLLWNLLKGLSVKCRIIMVGDDHQLPSVGPGQVLHDLIASNSLDVVELKELYRQGKNSRIITLAYDIRKKEIEEKIFNQEPDLTFISCPDEEVIENICEIANTYKDVSYKKFQILAPMYKGLNGIDEINKNIQKIFNPPNKTKKKETHGETTFQEEDKVIQLTNMPEENVYNGDIGMIEKIISSPKKEMEIDFDGNSVRYTPASYNNFRLAYAISIHKAQGSEFETVVIPIVKGYNKMLYQKLIYTGVTRAKKELYLIGDIKALKQAAKNVSNDTRRTTIKEYLINGIV